MYWKLLPICAYLCLDLFQVHATPLKNLSGKWIQVLSNKYVQETTEINWSCVTAEFQPRPSTSNSFQEFILVKRAFVYPANNVTVTCQHLIWDDFELRIFHPISQTQASKCYQIRELTNNILVMTGEDEPSLYVYTRNLQEYKKKDESRIVKYLKVLGYIV